MPSAASRLRSWTKLRKRVRSVKSSPPKRDDESAAAKGMHIRRHLAQPADESFGLLRSGHCIFFKLYGLTAERRGALCFAHWWSHDEVLTRTLLVAALLASTVPARAAATAPEDVNGALSTMC